MLNKPSIFIYHFGFEKTLNEESYQFFELLSNVGIIQKDAKEAATFLNSKNNQSINSWWNGRKLNLHKKIHRFLC